MNQPFPDAADKRTYTAVLILHDRDGNATIKAGPCPTAEAAMAALAELVDRLTPEGPVCSQS